ncbi:MAG TPA: M28 family peptidase [Longimicrobiales bacterium]|nr:M28 family peptidase [Longimicrobiales bacterium]
MSRSRPLTLLVLLSIAGCSRVGGGDGEFTRGEGPAPVMEPDQVGRRVIDARDIRSSIAYLASDEMRGRDTPSPELERAAAWIAERFSAAGLEPAGQDGGFIQFWPYEPEDVLVANVVALLLGTDAGRTGEYVILTAHFDHLGVGTPAEDGDSIYNGADDNASGTAALLELAEAFGALPGRPARPVLFLATSGKEKGLLGATWFADNPNVFLDDAVAVLNLDMIGRNSPDTVGVVGHDYSTLGPLLGRIARATRDLGLTLDTDPASGQDLFTRGDHYPFARLGIPAITITSAPHDDHHRPTDEVDRIDADKAARIARLVFLAAFVLAMGEEVAWTEAGRRAVP